MRQKVKEFGHLRLGDQRLVVGLYEPDSEGLINPRRDVAEFSAWGLAVRRKLRRQPQKTMIPVSGGGIMVESCEPLLTGFTILPINHTASWRRVTVLVPSSQILSYDGQALNARQIILPTTKRLLTQLEAKGWLVGHDMLIMLRKELKHQARKANIGQLGMLAIKELESGGVGWTSHDGFFTHSTQAALNLIEKIKAERPTISRDWDGSFTVKGKGWTALVLPAKLVKQIKGGE